MITFLRVRNLAIVEEFVIEPGPGLNVLTGETGAGKSLLIDSLEFISGARGSSELVRGGADKMQAEAAFEASEADLERIRGNGIELEDGSDLIIRRELSKSGRGRVLVSGSPVSVRELQSIADELLEIHGQDESRSRIAGKQLLQVLDEFGDNDTRLKETKRLYASWNEASNELRTLRAANSDRALKIDLLKYQLDEIESAGLKADEEDALREERAVLNHSQELVTATSAAFLALDEDDISATEQLSRAAHALSPLSRMIAEVGTLHAEVEEVRTRVRELARSLSRIADTVRSDPERLEEVEARLATIERLKKKYGGSLEAVIEHGAHVREEFDRLSDFEGSLGLLEQREAEAFAAYQRVATELSARRSAAAAAMQKEIERELKDLAMERTSVEIRIGAQTSNDSRLQRDGRGVAFGPDGFDHVEFLVAPNRGEEPKPIQKIASGGELSRIQLAIATALFRHETHAGGTTLVFDEIDSGVGGRVAEAVGRKLQELAQQYQVICVTHLPQIASLGSTHFRVFFHRFCVNPL
jgi:DNA repair protein RecN (Recombination protein N)